MEAFSFSNNLLGKAIMLLGSSFGQSDTFDALQGRSRCWILLELYCFFEALLIIGFTLT